MTPTTLSATQQTMLGSPHKCDTGGEGVWRKHVGRYGEYIKCSSCGRKYHKPRGATAPPQPTAAPELPLAAATPQPRRVTATVTPTMGVHDMLAAICPTLGVPGPHRILLWGPPGTGKSSGPAAWWPDKTAERVALTEDSAPEDLMGYYTLKGMDTQYSEGPATRALRHGRPLVLDEIDRTSSSIVSLLHALLDDVKIAEVTLPTGETLRPKEGYAVVATTNQSPQALHDALLDRFEMIVLVDRPHPGAMAQLATTLRAAVLAGYKSMKVEPWGSALSVRRGLAIERLVALGLSLDVAVKLTCGHTTKEILSVLASQSSGGSAK